MNASRLLSSYLRTSGQSPAAFAASVGANRSQIYRLLSGERGPGLDLANAIATATGGAVPASAWSVPSKAKSRAA